MATPPRRRPDPFRDALQITPEIIANLGDADFLTLMRELILAHAYRSGAPVTEVVINTEERAADGGSDGVTPPPLQRDAWFGDCKTCWQFKCGQAGNPANLTGEVVKPVPAETLRDGGRFVVVASSSNSGDPGITRRKTVLVNEAIANGIPHDKIIVFGSEQIATWCNEYPAIASRWSGAPAGLWRLSDWKNLPVHSSDWQASEATKDEIAAFRSQLDFNTGNLWHLHIQGPPGVGKSRFALELCLQADWKHNVIYIQQASDHRLIELVDSASTAENIRLMLVVDEIQANLLEPLRNSIDRSNGRIRAITIGHCPTPDPNRIPALEVEPLAQNEMRGLVRGLYDNMPYEHVEFIVHLAEGYVRLAKLAADAVVRDPTINVIGLLDLDHIRTFFNRMLGTTDQQRMSLYVVAVLSRVGWKDDLEDEGRAIAEHLNLRWTQVKADVQRLDDLYGIVPRGGRHRYISPTPLGTYLAMEAWSIYEAELRTLPEVLPNEESITAYYECLKRLASSPQVRDLAREELQNFFQLGSFNNVIDARRWSAFAAADEVLSARVVKTALSNASRDQRLALDGPARRTVVWTLVRLCWNAAAFHDAAISLALLSESENEKWSNNSSGEFVGLFDLFLGGTPVPYEDRLLVIDELIQSKNKDLIKLAIKALSMVAQERASRSVTEPLHSAPPAEWTPSSKAVRDLCVQKAISTLMDTLKAYPTDYFDDLLLALNNLSRELLNTATRAYVMDLMRLFRSNHPSSREDLRRIVWEVISNDKKYWNSLSQDSLDELLKFHSELEDNSIHARLLQHCGVSTWGPEENLANISEIAAELVHSPESLAKEWSWLTSGEAGDGWKLGSELARHDTSQTLDKLLPTFKSGGHDLRVLTSFANYRINQFGAEWLDRWIDKLIIPLHGFSTVVEISARCTMTVFIARSLISALENEILSPTDIRTLDFGNWPNELPFSEASTLFLTLYSSGNLITSLSALHRRLTYTQSESFSLWEDLALKLATTPSLVRSQGMISFYWKGVAEKLTSSHPFEIASAIFQQHSIKGGANASWFIVHSDAKDILMKCIEADAEKVWSALLPYLENPDTMLFLTIGFPPNVIDQLPRDKVIEWVHGSPDPRASVIGRICEKNFLDDSSIGARILGEYGHIEDVGNSFFSSYVSGVWSGLTSQRWKSLASHLDEVAAKTKLPKLRRWAAKFALTLKDMEKRELEREDEEGFGRY